MADELDSLRKGISEIDSEIIGLLVKRFDLTDEVGRIKKRDKMPIENKAVEEKIIERLVNKSGKDIDPQLIIGIYYKIFEESKRRQKVIS